MKQVGSVPFLLGAVPWPLWGSRPVLGSVAFAWRSTAYAAIGSIADRLGSNEPGAWFGNEWAQEGLSNIVERGPSSPRSTLTISNQALDCLQRDR